MDNTDRYLKKTSKVEQEAMFKNSKLQNIEKMQWLKATSYSPDFQKRKDISKKIHVDTNTKTVDAVLLKDNIKTYSAKESDENLSNDLVPKINENTQKKDIDIITLISNTNKLIDQEKKEEILSIVESIVSAQVEAEFSADKNQTDPADMSQNNETVTEPQTADQEVASVKQSDGNNNSTSVTLLSKEDNEQQAPCKITDDAEDTKPPVEAKNKDVQKQLGSVSKMKNKSNTSLSKIGEKSSTPGSTSFRKTIVNTSKSPPDRFKPVKSHDCVKKQESLKYERETKNTTPKSSTEKKNCETESNKTADAQSKSTDKVVPRQHVVSKQFVSKLKGQESHRKNAPTVKQVADKNKQETPFKKEEEATQSKIADLPSSGSETKEGKTVGEKTYQNNRKATGGGNMRRSTTFVSYKNSAYSKISQGKDMPRNIDETATSYRRSSLPYTPNNPRFDRFNNGNAQRRAIVKKEYINESYKSNSRIEDRSANNIESCKKQENEAFNQSNRIKSESKNSESSKECVNQVDASNVEPVKAKTDLKKRENSDDINNENTKQATASEQREKVIDKSEVDTPQQDANIEMKNKETNSPRKTQVNKEIKSEETNSLKQSVVNSHSNKFAVESQGSLQKYEQPTSKVGNAEYVKDASQFVSGKPTTWNGQTYDNTIQRTIAMNVQQSVQNMQYSLQQERNQTRSLYQPPPWDLSCDNKIQQFPNNNVRYSQLPNTFDTTQYEYNGMQAALCDDGAVNAPSALMPMMGVNVEQNPNMMYRYEPNLHQRPVAASSNFSGLTSSQMDEASRWSPSVQNRHLYVHVDQSYNSAPAQHAYNTSTPSEQSYNSTPEHSMHVYNTDINGMYATQATNCMPHPMIYAPTPCMQPWNSQLQYSIPVVYASPCASYAMVPATVNQLSNFDNIGPAHDQFKYVPYSRTNNYVKDAHDDANGCAAVQMRNNNTADNIKSNQYYKQCHDNCRFVYDAPPPMSHSRSQIDTSCTSATLGATHQCNAYRSTNQRYYRQNATNLRKQMQDLGCDDKDSEDIPPIISPKEFVTRSEFAPRGSCNQDQFKNVGCHTPQLQRYNGNGLRRNPSLHNFSREYTPSVIGRGRNKRI